MILRRELAIFVAGIAVFGLANSRAAQSEEKFKTHLGLVALDTAMRATIAGSGSVTATLTGNKLTVSGTFEGLVSPATTAHIHLSRVTGIRGS